MFGTSGVERSCAGCCLEALRGGALVTLFLEVRCVTHRCCLPRTERCEGRICGLLNQRLYVGGVALVSHGLVMRGPVLTDGVLLWPGYGEVEEPGA